MTEESTPPEGPETNPSPEKNNVQSRIDALTRQKRQALAERDQAASEKQQLNSRIESLETQLENLARSATAKPANPVGDYLSGRSQQEPAQSTPDLRETVQSVVQEALKPVVGHIQQSQIQAQQTASFEKAVSLVPGLEQDGGDLQKTFDQIWESDAALQRDPEGPLKAAFMAAGVLSNGARSSPSERKQSAASPAPSSQSQRLPDSFTEPEKASKDVAEKLSKHGRNHALNKDELAIMMGLQAGLIKPK